MHVYAPADNGLGDQWAAVNWCLRRSIARGETVYLTSRPVLKWHVDKLRPGRIELILLRLEPRGGTVHAVPDPETDRIDAEEIWRTPYLPTRVRWQPNNSRRICYQTDPVTLENKSVSQDQEQTLVETLSRKGYEPYRLHGDIPLEECVRILAGALALVSTSSGFSHVAHSVGTPLFLIQGHVELSFLIKHHVGKSYRLCRDYPEFLETFETDLRCGLAVPRKPVGTGRTIECETSIGHVIDRFTILEIKAERLPPNDSRCRMIVAEMAKLTEALMQEGKSDALSDAAPLRQVNRELWEVQAEQREQDRKRDFGEKFVFLSREIYRLNDLRCRLKAGIDQRHQSEISEVKVY